jgi:hypothetical protein
LLASILGFFVSYLVHNFFGFCYASEIHFLLIFLSGFLMGFLRGFVAKKIRCPSSVASPKRRKKQWFLPCKSLPV